MSKAQKPENPEKPEKPKFEEILKRFLKDNGEPSGYTICSNSDVQLKDIDFTESGITDDQLRIPKETDDPNIKYPIGIMPKWLHEEKRLKEIKKAITRYKEANLPPLDGWEEEAEELEKAISQQKSDTQIKKRDIKNRYRVTCFLNKFGNKTSDRKEMTIMMTLGIAGIMKGASMPLGMETADELELKVGDEFDENLTFTKE